MKQGIYGLFAIAAALMLGGCASMSADECLLSDWQTIGYEDGSRGYTSDRLGQHRKACAKHGVAPDFDEYRAGREAGLREFCQPARGFNLGASGGHYNGVCAADQEAYFLDAYRRGQHLHALRSNVQASNYAISARESELERVGQQIRDTQAALINPETPPEERVMLLVDLQELSEESGRLEAEIIDLIEERADHENELANYQAVLADSGY